MAVAADDVQQAIDNAQDAMDDVRAATNPLTGQLYTRVALTFVPSIVLFIAAVVLLNRLSFAVVSANDNPLVLGLVNFVVLIAGFLLARLVWQWQERRYQGTRLFKHYYALAQSMADLKRMIKRQGRGDYIAAAQIRQQAETMTQHCTTYIDTAREAGLT